MRYLKRRTVVILLTFITVIILIRYFILQSQVQSRKRHISNGFALEINEHVKLNPKQLVDLNNFHYILKPNLDYYEAKTRFLGNYFYFEYKSSYYFIKFNLNQLISALIIIHSYVSNDHVRAAHRGAISSKELLAYGFKRVFLLGDIPKKERYITQTAIQNEANRFSDILQGNSIDAYRNLTYKHIMGLKYVATEAREAQYVIKMDDDTVFDPFRMHDYIRNIDVDEDEYILKGFILSDQTVIREKYNKWFVTKDEFYEKTYPPYLSGWFYITNLKTSHDLVLSAETTDYFWIDDIYVTGILAEQLSIPLDGINDIFSSNSEFIDCCIKGIQHRRMQCDYMIGPNGGDSKLIISFIKAERSCHLGGCNKRDKEHHVKHTCVAQTKDLIRDRGQPIIQPIKL